MGIDTVFLVGVLVGQWLMLWVLWRMFSRLARLITYLETRVNPQPSSKDQIIDIFSKNLPERRKSIRTEK